MRRLLGNTFLRAAVAIVGGYALAASLFPADALIEFLSVVLLALASGVAAAYTGDVVRAARTNAVDYANLLITGILLSMVATASLRANGCCGATGGSRLGCSHITCWACACSGTSSPARCTSWPRPRSTGRSRAGPGS